VTTTRRGPRRLQVADFFIAVGMLVVFAGAFVLAQDWPTSARIFPTLVCSFGAVLALVKMVSSLRPHTEHPRATGHVVGDVELTDEDDEADEALEYVFEQATRSQWLRVVAWLVGFFAALWSVGAIPTVLGFGFAYLLFEAKASVPVAIAYVGLLAGALYTVQELLNIRLPPGLLLG
jgi:hypothetical protein